MNTPSFPSAAPPPPLPYGRQWVEEDDIAAVVECLRGDWLTQGPRVERFERALCEATGAAHAAVVSSGTAALHLAALALGVRRGDAVVVPAITFAATANAAAYCGARVFFADVDPATALVDLDALKRRVAELSAAGRPPKLLAAVDMAGQPADLPAVRCLADTCGAKVVEDAAHSLGGTYKHDGKTYRAADGIYADAAILSFHPVKHIAAGEGGAVLTNDAELAARVRELRSHGIHRDQARFECSGEGPWYYEQDALGFNYRLTDLQCALGLSQLKKLDRFLTRRRELAARYDVAFSAPPFAGRLAPLHTRPGVEHAYHLYVVRLVAREGETLAELAARRRDLYFFLRKKNIFTQIHYVPVNRHPYYRREHGATPGDCPGANAYYAGCLSLPLFPKMSDADAARVIEAAAEWCEKQ